MIKVKEIWLTDSAVWIRTEDGREARERFADYRLMCKTLCLRS